MIDVENMLGGMLRAGLGARPTGRRRHRMRIGGLPPAQLRVSSGLLGKGVLALAIAAYDHFARQRAAMSSPPMPPPPPPPPPRTPASDSDSLLLLRAMIAAAHADGTLDAMERDRILSRMQEAGFGEEERVFLEKELSSPQPMEALTSNVSSPAMAMQLYAASLLAIDVDEEHERAYLATLARRLGLDPGLVKTLHLEIEGHP